MEKRYKLREITPDTERCAIGLCPAIYKVKEITPEDERCGVGPCPAIYKTKNEECGPIGGCPTIEEHGDKYFIIGKVEDATNFGLEKKVGKGEVLISIPKGIIDKLKK